MKQLYTNPILDIDFPDPSVFLASDGWYYAYGTQTVTSESTINIQAARSQDLLDWEILPDVLPVTPSWAQRTQEFWAPQVIEHQGVFYMYYSAATTGHKGMGIGIATATSPMGPFIDIGQPLLTGEKYAVIDPMIFHDPISGKTFLYWGSCFEPIRVQELAPDLLHFAKGSKATEVLHPSKKVRGENLIEGAYVIYHDGYYYMFYSGDNCWGRDTYAIMVARAVSPVAPFEKMADVTGKAHSIILEYSSEWFAPGQNSVVTDATGQEWLFYHAVDPRNQYLANGKTFRRPMLMDPIVWENGWPQVKNGVASRSPQLAPITSVPVTPAITPQPTIPLFK